MMPQRTHSHKYNKPKENKPRQPLYCLSSASLLRIFFSTLSLYCCPFILVNVPCVTTCLMPQLRQNENKNWETLVRCVSLTSDGGTAT